MAAYDLEEQERIAAIKDWWDKWGNWILAAVIAFVLGVAGTQGWKYYQSKQAAEAEVMFDSVKKVAQEAAASREWKKVADAATAIADKYPSTFYATEAQLMAAKAAFEANDLGAARKHLEWVADKGRDTHKNIAKIRLAGVMLDDKKFDDALKTLESIKDAGFQSQVADLKGDIYAAQGRRDESRAAYELAVDKAEQRSPQKAISQAKLDAMGGAKPKAVSDKKDDKKDDKSDAKSADGAKK
jgi:predicted negative regulator of RcsB-dependent stress response